MKLVVGLGNPGQKYNGTRHNVGFELISQLGLKYGVGRPKSKFNAELIETTINNKKTILASPLTFMNLSGQTVQEAVSFYKLELDDLLIVCDDFNLDVGRLRFRPSGSAGGQNGLNDIIRRLGSKAFGRLRIGVGKPPPEWNVSNYVLGRFDEEDRQTMNQSIQRSVKAVEHWIENGMQSAMNQFNADPNQPAKKPGNPGNNKMASEPVHGSEAIRNQLKKSKRLNSEEIDRG
ncbi:MAG: aminoacyl-tRNA hydrolase [Mariniblastus sp.]|nr:aminoacyl-tRNA hydrolase [Mariniblastus sp.]